MKKIIFFDGVCNLCNGFVDFVIKFDKKQIFYFSPLQGEKSKELKIDFLNLEKSDQSIIYIDEKNTQLEKSDAVISIASELFSFGQIFLFFKIIPKFIRDWIYKIVAKNRYKIFGEKSTCRLPTPEERGRFLD